MERRATHAVYIFFQNVCIYMIYLAQVNGLIYDVIFYFK